MEICPLKSRDGARLDRSQLCPNPRNSATLVEVQHRENGRKPRWTRGVPKPRAEEYMHLSAVFIRRPIMASLLMAAFVLAGLFGYSNLPVSELPNVDFPTIDVNAGLPGAD